MLVVGLTGGVASGKTAVSRIWREEGAYLIDADQIARELVQPDMPAWHELQRAFGQEILQEDGSVDRRRLAKKVFSDPGQRDLLNRILHPRIKAEVARRVEEISRRDPDAIVVVDAALLIETGDYKEMDRLVLVTSTEEQQIQRLRSRDGITVEEAEKVLSAQMSLEEKLKVADFIIRNEGSLEETNVRAREVFKELKRIALIRESKA
ncbi:MAG: dephospho-CoA kinase [Syntrophaceae bacterium]|nr:dephospho-CoA kinase [Syntrophaceae bacterium]